MPYPSETGPIVYGVEPQHTDDATQAKPGDALPPEVLRALHRLVRDVRFGSIEIIVHDGRITQIERREKLRFTTANSPE